MSTGARGRDALLAAVLDALLPPGGDFPGAGAVALEEATAAVAARADLAALLDAIEAAAGGGRAFAALAADEREVALRAVERARPEPFAALVEVAYRAYYGHPEITRRLGFAGPPQPRGHVVPPMDPALVERVRRRPSLYRPV